MFFIRRGPYVILDNIYAVLIFLFSGSLLLSLLISPSVGSAVRVGGYFIFTLSNLIILPSVISFKHIVFLASRYSSILIILGFLPYIGIQSIFGLFDLSLWGANLYIYPALSPIRSIFSNPNALGFVVLVGIIAALIESVITLRRDAVALFLFNTVGLLFTNYRTGMVVFAITVSLCVVYTLFGQQMYTVSVVGGLTTFALLLLGMFGVIPGPTLLTEISLNGRRVLWRGAAMAVIETPLFGVGFGNYPTIVDNPHNSYLRMFLALGISGGSVYLLIVLRAILHSARKATDWAFLGVSLYLVAFFFVQTMNSLTFIGVSFHSVIISLLIGYHMKSDSLTCRKATEWTAEV